MYKARIEAIVIDRSEYTSEVVTVAPDRSILPKDMGDVAVARTAHITI